MPFTVEKDGKQIEVYTKEELDTEVAGLRVTLSNIKAEKESLITKANEAKAAALAAEEEKAKAEGDYEKLNQIMTEKLTDATQKQEAQMAQIKKREVDNAVNSIVTKLGAGKERSEDLQTLLRARFEFDYDSESDAVGVTGEGISTIQDLEKHVSESGRYDSYIAGNGASGGGSTGDGGSGGIAGKKPEEYTESERTALYRSDPEEFRRLFNN